MIIHRFKYTILAAGLALAFGQMAVGGISDPVADSFKGLDMDQDGFINQQETLNIDLSAFQAADADWDGRLNAQEFGRFLEEMADSLKKQDELSKEILMHMVAVGGKRPFAAAGLID